MNPVRHPRNLAASMGRWSAGHWKTAVFGWLAFVIASVAIGGAVGTRTLEAADANVGEARTADKIIDAGFPTRADEQNEVVLIQSPTLEADDPAFRAVIADVTKTLDRFPRVLGLQSPLDGRPDLISEDRHSVMVTFTPKGDYDETITYIESIEAAVDEVQARHRGFYVDEMGSASTGKAIDEAFGTMLKQAGLIALPIALVILLFVFGS